MESRGLVRIRQRRRRTARHGNGCGRTMGTRAERHLLRLSAALFPWVLRLCYAAGPQDPGPAWFFRQLGDQHLGRRSYFSFQRDRALRVEHLPRGGVPVDRAGPITRPGNKVRLGIQ